MVKCAKLGRELEGLEKPPWPGELGQRIFEKISKQAWQLWIGESTKLLNETRMDVTSPAAQKIYAEKMEAFLFGGDAEPPSSPLMNILSPDSGKK
jgi:Fe-S cluster biosynthesis and repair protein YggX